MMAGKLRLNIVVSLFQLVARKMSDGVACLSKPLFRKGPASANSAGPSDWIKYFPHNGNNYAYR
jgi:hypothetical protein